jgi:hypothetical protein
MRSSHSSAGQGGREAISYPLASLPLLLSLNRFLLIFISGAAISTHATAYS